MAARSHLRQRQLISRLGGGRVVGREGVHNQAAAHLKRPGHANVRLRQRHAAQRVLPVHPGQRRHGQRQTHIVLKRREGEPVQVTIRQLVPIRRHHLRPIRKKLLRSHQHSTRVQGKGQPLRGLPFIGPQFVHMVHHGVGHHDDGGLHQVTA